MTPTDSGSKRRPLGLDLGLVGGDRRGRHRRARHIARAVGCSRAPRPGAPSFRRRRPSRSADAAAARSAARRRCRRTPNSGRGARTARSAVHALTITSRHSSNRASASSIGTQKPGELVVAVAAADPEIEPAAGQQVEGRGLLGKQYRVVPGQHDDRGAEPQPAGAGAEPGQQVERRRDLAVAGEMVLDDKGAAKAQRLGLDVVVDEVAKPFAAVELAGRRRRAAALPNRPNCIAAISFRESTRRQHYVLLRDVQNAVV